MATSGTRSFELDVADYVEEAFERCGLELRTGYDLQSANRSLNLMLAEWANRGLNQWTVQQKQIPMIAGQVTYEIDSVTPTATIDVLDCFIRETVVGSQTDIPLTRLSRSQYTALVTKTSTGKPNQFYINKQITPTVTVWPQPDQSGTYTVICNILQRIEDAGTGANTTDVPFRFYPCLAAGLAYYMALKRAPDKVGLLKQLYEEEFDRAMSQDEERASFNVAPNLRSYNNP
jgi:hypothetical protein